MKQGQSGPPAKHTGGKEVAVSEEARPPAKPAVPKGWGQGAASALESLKTSGYRGRRSKPADDRPKEDRPAAQ